MSDATSLTPACPYCLSKIEDDAPKTSCPSCRAVYHQECWDENGGCAVYGCTQVPVVESRRGMEVPMSYWGRENKPCPSCGKEILAAALRCRHCGTTFTSARPESTDEFQSRIAIAASADEARRTTLWIFAVSIVPFLAPVGAIWGWWWHRSNRDSVDALPSLYGALRKIGFIVSCAITLAVVTIGVIYLTVRHF